MITKTCNICKQIINESNPEYNEVTELSGSFPGALPFVFKAVVLSFDFNCTNFHVCGVCVRDAMYQALRPIKAIS